MTGKSSQHRGESLTAHAYKGDGCVLLAFDLDEKETELLAGFAVQRTDPKGHSSYLYNRLGFDTKYTAQSTASDRKWTPSNEAPFQKFRWVDFPGTVLDGEYRYDVTAIYFTSEEDATLTEGTQATVKIDLNAQSYANFQFGYTRGYLSSQAYAEQFKNAPIRPGGAKTIDFNTAEFEKQYEWLGFHARELLFALLDEIKGKAEITVDLFAYDLDEPDFIRAMTGLGPRLRAYLDNASLHTKPGAAEIDALAALTASAGEDNVKTGHFKRFAHDKVLILKKHGKPYKVLTGSANFSVRGLYVQANNVLVINDPATAALYEEAFEQSFNDASGFAHSEIAEGWHEVSGKGIPDFAVAFSPHTTAEVSLQRVADTIDKASSSVLFAIMELSGGGPVLDDVRNLASRPRIFGYGVTQRLTGLSLYKPGAANGVVVPFAFLKDQVPQPFQEEWSGGAGQVIHDKFIVVDFNGSDPAVFTGSSNLAGGGEVSNGDNLLMITDPGIVTAFAVEAVRLVDHYHFRAAMQEATDVKPLTLQGPVAQGAWWEDYYDSKNVKFRERVLFAGGAAK